MFKLISAIQDFVRRHQAPATAIASDLRGLLLQARGVLIEARGKQADDDGQADGDKPPRAAASVSITFGKSKRSAAEQTRGGQS